MQHDLFRSCHDLDLRSNYGHGLLRSNYNKFDASRQEEHDALNLDFVSLLSQRILPKTCFGKTAIFILFALWRLNR